MHSQLAHNKMNLQHDYIQILNSRKNTIWRPEERESNRLLFACHIIIEVAYYLKHFQKTLFLALKLAEKMT